MAGASKNSRGLVVGASLMSLMGGAGCVTADRLAGALRDPAQGRGTKANESIAKSAAAESSENDIVFYVDGAGGGGLILDFSREIHRGLNDAAFAGEFHNFVWQTGLGAVSDECASVQYKREKARLLVNEIRLARLDHPTGRICVMAASAGTAVAVFALEALPENVSVDSVVLLSSALSSTYNLTPALKHVRGDLYVFTSPNDALLKIVMPVLGTSDRAFVDAHAAGLEGFMRPADADGAEQYEKVREIRWQPAWTALGNPGGHTDCKSPAFVRTVVAPLLAAAN